MKNDIEFITIIKNPIITTKVCLGFNSICKDKKHVLLLDFDVSKSRLNRVEYSLFCIMKKYDLSTFYIFDSSNGYNAICLSKLSLQLCTKIRSECKYSDALHNKIGHKRKGWVLRIGEDKKFVSVVFNYTSKIKKSNAHRILLHSVYGIPIQQDNNFDNYTKILFEKYVQKRSVENGTTKNKK